MRATGFIGLFVFAILTVLTSVDDVNPVMTGVFAQGAGAAPRKVRREGADAEGRQASRALEVGEVGAGDPGASGRRDALAPGSVRVEELLQGQGALAGQALLPMQRPRQLYGMWDQRPHRPQSARLRLPGATATPTGRGRAS